MLTLLDLAFLQDLMKDLPGLTPEQKVHFTSGLERVLAESASQQQPFPAVASRLIAYRRQAVNDPTALLMLNLQSSPTNM
jgi:hypothetical protein